MAVDGNVSSVVGSFVHWLVGWMDGSVDVQIKCKQFYSMRKAQGCLRIINILWFLPYSITVTELATANKYNMAFNLLGTPVQLIAIQHDDSAVTFTCTQLKLVSLVYKYKKN